MVKISLLYKRSQNFASARQQAPKAILLIRALCQRYLFARLATRKQNLIYQINFIKFSKTASIQHNISSTNSTPYSRKKCVGANNEQEIQIIYGHKLHISGKAKQNFNTKRPLEYVHSEKRLHVEFLNFLSGK